MWAGGGGERGSPHHCPYLRRVSLKMLNEILLGIIRLCSNWTYENQCNNYAFKRFMFMLNSKIYGSVIKWQVYILVHDFLLSKFSETERNL